MTDQPSQYQHVMGYIVEILNLAEKSLLRLQMELVLKGYQASPKSIGILTILRSISGPNLETLTQNVVDLSHGRSLNEVKFQS